MFENPDTTRERHVKHRILRLLLGIAAFGWLISVLGVVLPWDWALVGLQGLGAPEIAHDPMLDYWMRMAAGAFTGIGIFFLLLALHPERYANLIRPAGMLMVAEGVVLLVHGLRLGLRPFPFVGDTSFCLLIGLGIWLLHRETSPSGTQ